MTNRDQLWTIDDLGVQVALALSVDYQGAADDRIRDVPDRRTIRYYTTLGLIDRPAEFRGRVALYGRKHLVQLVAIKRLQTQGLTLAEVQERLLGLSLGQLEKLARLPADLPEGSASPASPRTEKTEDRSRSFWRAAPATVAASELPVNDEADQHSAQTLQGIRLDPRATLLLAPLRPLENDDLEALHAVAAPLLKLLEKRRLI